MNSPAMRARLACRLAGADLRLEPDGDPCRAGRALRERGRAGLIEPSGGTEPAGPTEPLGLTGLNGRSGLVELKGSSGLLELKEPSGLTGTAASRTGPPGSRAEGPPGPGGAGTGGPAAPTGRAGVTGPPGARADGPAGPEGAGTEGPPGPKETGADGPAGSGGAGPTGAGVSGSAGMAAAVGSSGLRGSALGSKGSAGLDGLVWRGPGATEPRGLAWPPRSLELQDTIRLPVTFAVSARGLFPWLRHAELGPAAYRKSVCREPGPVPPWRSRL
jgi:hypothetical protein